MKFAVPSIFDPAKEISENCIDEGSGGILQSKDTECDNHHCTCDETESLLLKVKRFENENAELGIANQKLISSTTKMRAAYDESSQKCHRLSKELTAAKVKIEKLEREIIWIAKGRTFDSENAESEKVKILILPNYFKVVKGY